LTLLGFSLSKLIVLSIIIMIVWYGFRILRRRNQVQNLKSDQEKINSSKSNPEDMEKCKVCTTFIPIAVAKNCGRDGCPY